MLVLLGPDYGANDDEILALAQETGLSQYDLRARLCPGTWGVIKAIADVEQAADLASRLFRRGLPACSISPVVGKDAERCIVYLREIKFEWDFVRFCFAEREMTIPYRALLVVVRGDVHVGRSPQWSSTSGTSGSIRPPASSSSLLSSTGATGEYVRESRASVSQDVFSAADIHFATVTWVARIDARGLEFPVEYANIPNFAERLDCCIEDLATKAQIRIDRALRTSGLASHTAGPQKPDTTSSQLRASARRAQVPSDEHFDAYSRMVAEAERVLLRRKNGELPLST